MAAVFQNQQNGNTSQSTELTRDFSSEDTILTDKDTLRNKRLSLAEKKELRYLRRKSILNEKCKAHRKKKGLALSNQYAKLSPEEVTRMKEAVKLEETLSVERLKRAQNVGIRVCIECNFMNNEREIRSLCRQISQTYGANKRASFPVDLHITSLHGEMAALLATQGAQHWIAALHAESALTLFPKELLIVLSPDAEETLQEIADGDSSFPDLERGIDRRPVFVIGGIVDRSLRKNVSLEWAKTHNVNAMRLPIAENLSAATGSPVLNIDTVLEVLCSFMETKSWSQAVSSSVPLRKSRTLS